METKRVYACGDLYMGAGHLPHPHGTALEMLSEQAETWEKHGLVSFDHPAKVKPAEAPTDEAAAEHEAEHPAE